MSSTRKANRAAEAEARKDERQAVARAEAARHETAVKPTAQKTLADYNFKPGEPVPLHVLNAMAEASREAQTEKITEAAQAAAKAVVTTLGSHAERKITKRYDNAAKASARLAATKV